MQCAVVQPPFVQLNTVYPAAWYLESRLVEMGHGVLVGDHSIETFRSIFCRAGLARVFADAVPAWKGKSVRADSATRSQVERYFSSKQLYIDWIDDIMAYLSGADPGFAHRLSQAAERPVGSRTERFLEASGGRPSPEEAPILATRILEDIADFISFTLDQDFGTIRYADRLASGIADFGILEKRLESSYIMGEFYRPLVRNFLENEAREAEVFLVTIPFPGCLAGALSFARETRLQRGLGVPILFGGGYVSTELRRLTDSGIFDYCDYLCFDSGYRALSSILDHLRGVDPDRSRLRQTMYRDSSGSLVKCGIDESCAGDAAMISLTFPDYSRVDFSRYLRIVDSANPMHRLWSDTPWLKFHLAYGCYWRRCSFCDTTLDYVATFIPSNIAALAAACDASARATGLYGIHFVDEAMPMAGILSFAESNRRRRADGLRPFHFWGNVRFDKSWTPERCELAASSGLIAVSGGIEIASESGLAMTDKGFDLEELVRCLVGMKSAGILVHAYLIYGFPAQTELQIVESAEVVRQMFAAGLVDSAFWHRFVLTRHSRMYTEWKSGRAYRKKDRLVPKDGPRAFADNDLDFEGSGRFAAFDAPVAASLAAWMEGEFLDRPVWEWFPGFSKKDRGRLPGPDLIESLIGKAERHIDASYEAPPPDSARAYWTGGLPFPFREGESPTESTGLSWSRRGFIARAPMPVLAATRAAEAIEDLSRRPEGVAIRDFLASAFPGEAIRYLDLFRGDGLVIV